MFSTLSPALLFWLVFLAAAELSSGSRIVPSAIMDQQTNASKMLLAVRSSPSDLEIAGELEGAPKRAVRYVRYEDLLKLPQESYQVDDDGNFKGSTIISGVPLSTLATLFGQDSRSDLIIAICYDKYRSNYPSDYMAKHHPILVLKINGKLRDQWPLSEDGGALGPYLISHPPFTPSFKILAHEDEAQIPFGVVRLEFRRQSEVFSPIEPKLFESGGTAVRQGYEIARQDCFRCHGLRSEGGERASRSWLILGAWAATDPVRFKQYVHDPKSVQACAKMPAHASYDAATLDALTRYFSTFAHTRPGE